MGFLNKLYHEQLGLLTDLYELTMAYGYWKLGMHQTHGAFHVFFRRNPFGGGYTLFAGLGTLVDYLDGFGYSESDVEYLGSLTGADGKPLFEQGFLDYLRSMHLELDIDAPAEGMPIFPQEPIVRVTGPLLQCQIIETALLNILNYQSLVATKASRVCRAAGGEPVLEFGLRRAQGIDGGVSAARGAYIGGCSATSNVMAGKLLGIPVKGTHAHSWVMAFDNELASFRAYAKAMPNNCIFLVDTYDTLEGVRNAAKVAKELKKSGHDVIGIRLDSGDLAYLSKEASKILQAEGLGEIKILASNELDENIIHSLKDQGATICVWGVGTKLVTAYDEPALTGVYKLTAIKDGSGQWQHRIKLSEQMAKVTTPGILQVRRYEDGGTFAGDMIYDTLTAEPEDGVTIIDPIDPTRRKKIPAGAAHEDILKPVMREGDIVHQPPPLEEIRRRAGEQLSHLYDGVKRFVNPHIYPAGLEKHLHERKTHLVLEARNTVDSD